VPVADEPAPDLAVRAAVDALAGAGRAAGEVGLVVHAWTYHQGHDFWSPAHYVAHRIGAPRALPFGVQQMCNAGAAGLGIAASRLLLEPDLQAAVVTTADSFTGPGFDRWAGDYAVVYGDAGTAAVLGRRRRPGGLVLRSIAYATAAEFETMYRGDDPFSPAPHWRGERIDVRRTKRAYLAAAGGMESFQAVATGCVLDVVLRALGEAGVAPHDPRIRAIFLPRLSDSVLDLMYVAVLDGHVAGKPHRLGEGSGHLGAGDMMANLTHLDEQDLLDPGEIALFVGGGGGFTWSCAVVERARP
jgi:3-oxoacyl-[acyl-carrier-protein] synthase-3